MANFTTNDEGHQVIAIGAPGSLIRIGVEYPIAIGEVDELYFKEGTTKRDAVRLLKERGITATHTVDAIINYHSMFKR